ncbi:hypothetical protein HY612_03820 [Candidatus Roizmanbacteria bacterium]|nr:hypothetical protein [Candidatus Roizmanbacteria bacterium]
MPELSTFFEKALLPPSELKYGIPVYAFMEHYGVENPQVVETLERYPTLCYLLGQVTEVPVGSTAILQPDGVERPIRHLVEGSGMFGLKDQDDAMRWAGIFGHSIGMARQAWLLYRMFEQLSPGQMNLFLAAGYDFRDFIKFDSNTVRDGSFANHCSRRWHDEHNVDLKQPQSMAPGQSALNHLITYKAPQFMLDLIRVEDHFKELQAARVQEIGGRHRMPDIVFSILTLADWTIERKTMPLDARFARLRGRGDLAEVLPVLEECGKGFEADVNRITGVNIVDLFNGAGPFDWEYKIRSAYCATSGLEVKKAFPEYFEQYPELG